RADLGQSEKRLEAARNGLTQQKARLRALEEMRGRFEGFTDGVKNLMAKRDPSLLGLVVDRIQAPAELTAPLAGPLGNLVECVVVSDTDRAIELLGELALGKEGRASVVPQVPRRVVGRHRPPLEGEGVMGPLLDRLTYAPEDEGLVLALVGDAVLVESA